MIFRRCEFYLRFSRLWNIWFNNYFIFKSTQFQKLSDSWLFLSQLFYWNFGFNGFMFDWYNNMIDFIYYSIINQLQCFFCNTFSIKYKSYRKIFIHFLIIIFRNQIKIYKPIKMFLSRNSIKIQYFRTKAKKQFQH